MELNEMDIKTCSRWMALILAIDNIDTYCQFNDKCFDSEVLKPIPIKHFIEEKSKVIEHILRNKQNQKEREINNTNIFDITKKIINNLVYVYPV